MTRQGDKKTSASSPSSGFAFANTSSSHRPKHSWSETLHTEGTRGLTRRVLSTTTFDYVICAAALLNSILIGLEQNTRLQHRDTSAYHHCETAFVVFYILELLFVFYGFGKRALCSNWVRLDLCLALAGFLSQFVIARADDLGKSISILLLLRMVRMLRLARTLRVMARFRELWMLAQGFVNSLNMLFHTLVLGVVILYVYGCVAVELIPLSFRDSSEELSEELQASIEHHFRSLPTTMLTLVQFVTFDSPHAIYRPWIEAHPALSVFFIAALLVMGVVFMNLVTAVIVNSALESAMQDQVMQKAVLEKNRKCLLANLKRAFEEADANKSGELSREELATISEEEQDLLCTMLGQSNSDLVKLFDFLDVDGDGEIGISEFCLGIESLVMSDTPLEIKRMEKMMESIRRQLKDTMAAQRCIIKSVNRVSSVLSIPQERLEHATTNGPCTVPTMASLGKMGSQLPTGGPVGKMGSLDSLAAESFCLVPSWANDILGELRELGVKLDESLAMLADNSGLVEESNNLLAPEDATTKCEALQSVELCQAKEGVDCLPARGELCARCQCRLQQPPEFQAVFEGSTYLARGEGQDSSSNEDDCCSEGPWSLEENCEQVVAAPTGLPRSLPPVLLALSSGRAPADEGASQRRQRL